MPDPAITQFKKTHKMFICPSSGATITEKTCKSRYKQAAGKRRMSSYFSEDQMMDIMQCLDCTHNGQGGKKGKKQKKRCTHCKKFFYRTKETDFAWRSKLRCSDKCNIAFAKDKRMKKFKKGDYDYQVAKGENMGQNIDI